MAKFIEVESRFTGDRYLINAESVMSIIASSEGSSLCLIPDGKKVVKVSQTLDELKRMLDDERAASCLPETD